MHYSTETATFTLYTLVDITDSKVTNPKQSKIGFYQAQNLNSFVQTISLRTQPEIVDVKSMGNKDLAKFNFGNEYKKRKVWKIEFTCENPSAWTREDNPVALLEQDFNLVPVHVNLKENAKFPNLSVDTVSDEHRNTYFTFN